MHIAIDVRSLMEGRHSGVEEYTTQIIRAMARVAPRHTYHLFYNSAREVTLPKFASNVVEHAFRYPNKFFNTAQWLTGYPRWDRLVHPERGRRKMDVFFVPNPRLMPLSAPTPLVVVAHDLSFERFPEFLNLRRRAWHAMMRPRLLMQNADHVIAVSEHTKHDLMSLYDMKPDTISVIHSGIAQENKTARSVLAIQRMRQQYHLPERFVLYVGRLEPRKNIPGIIRAYSAVANRVPHHLVIAGEAGWREQGITDAIEESRFRERIHLIGFVAQSDKPALYAAADLFVYPSFYEGFGFPPLESLVAGTPVVTSFNSALPEVVGKWATLIDPYNTAQIAAVIQELLTQPERVPPLVQQEIRQTYSWDTAARQTIKVLESVA